MPALNNTRTDSLNPSGGTINYSLLVANTKYFVTGMGTLSGGIVIQQNPSDNLYEGITYDIAYRARMTYSGGNAITVFGRALSATEAMQDLAIKAIYTSGAWVVEVLLEPSLQQYVKQLTGGGGTFNINPLDGYSVYVLEGTATLSGSWTVQIDPSVLPLSKPANITVIYSAALTLNGNNVTIQGQVLTAQQALKANSIININVDSAGASNVITATVTEGSNVVRIVDGVQTTTYSGGDLTISLNPNIDKHWQVITGTGGGGNLTGDIIVQPAVAAFKDGETFYVKYECQLTNTLPEEITLFGISLTNDDILLGNTTVIAVYDLTNNIWVAQKISVPSLGVPIPVAMHVSMAVTGSVCQFIAPFNCIVTQYYSCVETPLAGGDGGVVTFSFNGSPPTPSTFTIPAGSVQGYTATATFSAGNTLTTGQTIKVSTSKTNLGGTATVFLYITPT